MSQHMKATFVLSAAIQQRLVADLMLKTTTKHKRQCTYIVFLFLLKCWSPNVRPCADKATALLTTELYLQP